MDRHEDCICDSWYHQLWRARWDHQLLCRCGGFKISWIWKIGSSSWKRSSSPDSWQLSTDHTWGLSIQGLHRWGYEASGFHHQPRRCRELLRGPRCRQASAGCCQWQADEQPPTGVSATAALRLTLTLLHMQHPHRNTENHGSICPPALLAWTAPKLCKFLRQSTWSKMSNRTVWH